MFYVGGGIWCFELEINGRVFLTRCCEGGGVLLSWRGGWWKNNASKDAGCWVFVLIGSPLIVSPAVRVPFAASSANIGRSW